MRRSEAELGPTPTSSIKLKKTAKKLKQGSNKIKENHGTAKKSNRIFARAKAACQQNMFNR